MIRCADTLGTEKAYTMMRLIEYSLDIEKSQMNILWNAQVNLLKRGIPYTFVF
jgi:hypothetical protein